MAEPPRPGRRRMYGPEWHEAQEKLKSGNWTQTPDLLYRIPIEPKPVSKIAAFDLFNTLIHSDRGSPVLLKVDDWVWFSDDTPKHLRKLNRDGFTVVIFSDHRPSSLELLRARTEKIIEDLQFAPWIFYGIADSTQKPNIKNWETFIHLSGLISPSIDSFYAGDASGRFDSNPAYRWSDRDRQFAQAIGLSYFTPDEKLPKQPEPYYPSSQELIIVVGQQLSGANLFVEKLVHDRGYIEITRKSKTLIRDIKSNLVSRKSVIFNATNPKLSDRKQIIGIAREEKVPVRIFWFSNSGFAVNQVERKYPETVLRIYSSSFERPGPDDGVPVIRIN